MTSLRDLREKIAPYEKANNFLAAYCVLNTLAALAVSIGISVWILKSSLPFLVLLMAIPNGFLFVRLFVLMHDMCHGSFFKQKWLNQFVGTLLSAPVLTPFFAWRRSHNIHHVDSGKMEKPQHPGEIGAVKVSDYLQYSKMKRFFFRLRVHPLLLFTVNAWALFMIVQRLPFQPKFDKENRVIGVELCRPRDIINIMATNTGLLLMFVVAWYFGVLAEMSIIYIPAMMVASTVGVWLFFIQHHYEDVYWEDKKGWSLKDAALKGASFYDLPKIVHWASGNIGYHHIHHFSTKIPSYSLAKVFRNVPEINIMKRLTVLDSFKCAGFVLLDEQKKKLVTIKEAMASLQPKPVAKAA